MKTLLLTGTLAALVLGGAAPGFASEFGTGTHLAGAQAFDGLGHDGDIFERRGRGRGRGSDDRGGDDRRGGRGADDDRQDGTRGGGHGGRPRIPGGSGCDDAHDLAEHPECRG